MQNAVIYVRVSSKEQHSDGYSIPAQEKLLTDYALANGIAVIRTFKDVESAKQSGRTAFNEMLEFMQQSADCKSILVEKTDRLYRNFEDAVRLGSLGVDIHFVKEGTVFNRKTKSSEKLQHDLKLVIAKNYIDNLSEETRKGMTEKARQGLWPTVAPLGYLNDRETGMIIPDPERAPLIKRLFEAYASGRYSYSQLTKLAWEMGLRSKKGNKLPKSGIARIINGLTYTGEFEWNGVRYIGKYEPIISKALFDQAESKRTAVTHSRPKRQHHAFKGMIRCGTCGCLVTAQTKRGRYTYYHCTHGRGDCREKAVTEEALALMLGEPLERLRLDRERVQWIHTLMLKEDKKSHQARVQERRRIEKNQQDLERKLDLVYEDKLAGTITPAFWKKKHNEYTAQLRWIEEELERMDTDSATSWERADRIIELSQKAHSLYLSQNMDEKRKLLEVVLSNTSMRDKQVSVEFKKTFEIIADGAKEDREKRRRGESILTENGEWLPEWDGNTNFF